MNMGYHRSCVVMSVGQEPRIIPARLWRAGRRSIAMKHHRTITRKPQMAQTSNFQVFKEFLERLVDQAIEFIFQMTM